MPEPVNLNLKLSMFSDHWAPRIIAQFNAYHIKLVKLQGEFVWHSHPETDEVFLVLAGQLTIHFRDGEVVLDPNELYVVPRGVEHMPSASTECHVLLIEPAGTINTGNTGGERTAANDAWI